jgi:hypothetical protein
MADQDIGEYLEQNPDITSGDALDKDSILGVSGSLLQATKKISQTLGSFKEKLSRITNSSIFTSLKSIGGRIVFNGEGNYDPSKNLVIIGGLKMKGVVDCTIKVEQAFGTSMGLAGEVMVYENKKSGPSMDLTLLRTSPSRNALQQAYNQMISQGSGLLDVIIQDNGDTVFNGKAVISKMPDHKLDIEGADVVYSFQFI